MERLRKNLRKIGAAGDRDELEQVLRECLPISGLWLGQFGEAPERELDFSAHHEGFTILTVAVEGEVDPGRAAVLVERAGARWQELRSAQAYREFFTHSADLLCVAGFDGYFKLLNPAWESVLGYSLEELCSRPFLEFVHPEDREETDGERERLTVGAVRTWLSFENRYQHRDGAYRWLSWRSRADSEAGLIYAVARDVTAQRQLVEELRQRNEDLETFAYVASHDLRAPLRAVDNLSQWLENDARDRLSGDSLRHLDLLRQRVKRMEALLEALLAYSRAGRDGALERVDSSAVVQEVVDLLAEPDIRVAGNLPEVTASQAALRQIFLNLISNAVKHGPPDVTIEVGADDRGSEWEFWVADNGPGIPPEYRERVFLPFNTLKPRDEVEGAGIGLAIVRRQVQRRGGRVWVEGRPSGGAVLRFTWPKEVACKPEP